MDKTLNFVRFVTLFRKTMVESLILSTFIIACIIALVCLTSNQSAHKRVLLTTFFGLIAIQSGIKYLGFTNPAILKENPLLLLLPELTAVLIPEIIYLYVLTLVNKTANRSLYYKLLILPIFTTSVFLAFYGLTNGFRTDNKFYLFEMYLGMLSFTFLTNILFIALSLKEIKNVLSNNLVDLSKYNHIALIWVQWLLWLLLIRAVFSITFFILNFIFPQEDWLVTVTLVQKTAVAVIMLIATSLTAYYGLRNPMLFDTINETPSVEQALAISFLTPEVKKVIKKNIKDEDISDYLSQIESIVSKEQLFLNSNLTPPLLAQRIGIPVYKLTLALNKGAGKNFNEFINTYRVEYAKMLLTSKEHIKSTIFSIALDSGFSSEAPFYAAFKKQVGQSPSAFRSSFEENA